MPSDSASLEAFFVSYFQPEPEQLMHSGLLEHCQQEQMEPWMNEKRCTSSVPKEWSLRGFVLSCRIRREWQTS